MNGRPFLLFAVAAVVCGCSTIKKMATPAIQVELMSSKSQDTTEYWQQQWQLRSSAPVALKLFCAGKTAILLPSAGEGQKRYTVTMRLGRTNSGVQGMVAIVEGSDPKKPGKTSYTPFVLKEFPKGALRGGTHPATTAAPGKAPFTLDLLKLGVDPQPVATLTCVPLDQTAQFRNEAR